MRIPKTYGAFSGLGKIGQRVSNSVSKFTNDIARAHNTLSPEEQAFTTSCLTAAAVMAMDPSMSDKN